MKLIRVTGNRYTLDPPGYDPMLSHEENAIEYAHWRQQMENLRRTVQECSHAVKALVEATFLDINTDIEARTCKGTGVALCNKCGTQWEAEVDETDLPALFGVHQ